MYSNDERTVKKMDAKTFGAFIAKCRKEKNMTQADLALKLNCTDKAVNRWERGIGFPEISTIETLASALEISVSELMQSERAASCEVPENEESLERKTSPEKAAGLTRIFLVLFAGTNILYTFGAGDRLLQTICMIVILVAALLLSFTIWKQNPCIRTRCALMQALYCGLTALTAFRFSLIAGNIIAGILIIAITVLYIRFSSAFYTLK